MQESRYSRLGAADLQMGKALAGLQELVTGGALKAVRLGSEMLGDFELGFSDEFRCGGRSGSAQVGGEVCDGEIGFVADSGDDGQARRGDGPGRHARY